MINNRYKISEKIGQGRSDVFLCEDTEYSNTKIAIKILKPDASLEEKQNFRKEFFILKKLEHPNIIRAYEYGNVLSSDNDQITENSLFITLEYFPSTELLKNRSVFNEELLKEILKQICSALYYLHQSNYIYYDLKPENILFNSESQAPRIKLIDLGLAEYSPAEISGNIKGTAAYIAPELLKKEKHDFRIDLYSLGIMLYRIIYGRFPFDSSDDMSIYKAHIETEFEFPEVPGFSNQIIGVIKKLLNKDPDERPYTALHVLQLLDIKIDKNLCKDFLPVKIFSGREDAINILRTYIEDKTSSEIFTIKGFESSGKTALLNKVYELFGRAVRINVNDLAEKNLWNVASIILKKFLYTEGIFKRLDNTETRKILHQINDSQNLTPDILFHIIAKLTSHSDIILIIDDYNLFDDYTIEIFNQIMPALQINGVKIILSETSETRYRTDELNNVREFSLTSLTDVQLGDLIDASFHKSFPKKELFDLIVTYSDLLVGSIFSFIKDLILLDIMKFDGKGVSLSGSPEELKILEESHESIYKHRLNRLNENELTAINIVSCFESTADSRILQKILNKDDLEFKNIISNLCINNLLVQFASQGVLRFTSDGLKKHIYHLLDDKTKWHNKIASVLMQLLPDINQLELARQLELADRYEESYQIYILEFEEAEKKSAYNYACRILLHLLDLPLNARLKTELKIKLAETYYKLSDYKKAIETINKTDLKLIPEETLYEVEFILASSLLGAGEFLEARNKLKLLNGKVNDRSKKNKILTELAYADFELGNYSAASNLSHKLISNGNLDPELSGKCFNLLGMNEIYNTNNLKEALKWFNDAKVSYEKAKLPRRLAGTEVNIGNIYNILGQYEDAKIHWNAASEINKEIGNLEQEGILQLNTGIFYFERCQFEQAIELYNLALRIFLSTGKFQYQGLALLNLGESHLYLCEYQDAYLKLNEAYSIFHDKNLHEDEAAALFLLGKFFYKINLKTELTVTIERLEKLAGDKELSGRHPLNLTLLKYFNQHLTGDNLQPDLLFEISNEYLKIGDRTNFVESSFLAVQLFLEKKCFQEALNLLFNKDLVEFSRQSVIFEAERLYYSGQLSTELGSDKLTSPIEYFEQAYELIKESSISEITWKILFKLSEIYFQRGNYQKAKNYISYTRELLLFISEQIETPRLRKAFQDRKDVADVTEKLESLNSN